MQISDKGLIELASYEALAHTKYLDSGGVETIGIGMTTSEIKDLHSWPWDKSLSTKECFDQFKIAVKKYAEAVDKFLQVPIEQHKFDALVSITYNIGINGMIKSSFMKRINAKDGDKNVVKAMQMWNKDNGKVVKGLVNRRAAESDLYLNGRYRSGGKVTLIEVSPKTHKPSYKGTIDLENLIINVDN